LKHELAYCLGQMKNPAALPVLESILKDKSEDPMVRHEVSYNFPLYWQPSFDMIQAAEAMGAISASSSIPILQNYLTDPDRTVRETCEIAIAKIQWDNSEEGRQQAESSKDSTVMCGYFFQQPTNLPQLHLTQKIYICRSRSTNFWAPIRSTKA
jgi:deoxyhypusine monooxygenase